LSDGIGKRPELLTRDSGATDSIKARREVSNLTRAQLIAQVEQTITVADEPMRKTRRVAWVAASRVVFEIFDDWVSALARSRVCSAIEQRFRFRWEEKCSYRREAR
jgi:hypothetical protein